MYPVNQLGQAVEQPLSPPEFDMPEWSARDIADAIDDLVYDIRAGKTEMDEEVNAEIGIKTLKIWHSASKDKVGEMNDMLYSIVYEYAKNEVNADPDKYCAIYEVES